MEFEVTQEMRCRLRANRMRIDGYLTELKNKIDLQVEIYIQDNQHDPTRINELNKARDEWIEEIDLCQTYNFIQLEKNENKYMILEDEHLFKNHCFVIQFFGNVLETGRFTWRFFSTDIYLRPGQIECFEAILFLAHNVSENAIASSIATSLRAASFERYFIKKQCESFYLSWREHLLKVECAKVLNEDALTKSLSMIKASSDELFTFNHLEVKLHDKESILQAFQPDAKFIFANTRSTWLKLKETASIQHAEKFFELVECGQRISFLGLDIALRTSKFTLDSYIRVRLNALHLSCNFDWHSVYKCDPECEYNVFLDSIDDIFHFHEPWPQLTELKIEKCKITFLSSALFKQCPQLRKLDLSIARFVCCQPGYSYVCAEITTEFDHANSLVELILTGTRFKFSPNCMSALVNLRVLKIDWFYNDLDSLNLPENLEELDLLTLLPRLDKFPAQLLNLLTLKLTLPECEWIASTAFDHLIKLKRLELLAIKLCEDFETSAPALQTLTCKLKRLKLNESNSIQEVFFLGKKGNEQTLTTCSSLTGLKQLELPYIPLLKGIPFRLTPFLERLELNHICNDHHCKDDFQKEPFQDLTKLHTLIIKSFRNYIYTFENQLSKKVILPASLSSLTRLDISGCSFYFLISIQQNMFKHTPNLEYLYFVGNCITFIEPGAFLHLSKLKHLDLRDNCIRRFPFDTLYTDLANLEFLSLSRNPIATLDGGSDWYGLEATKRKTSCLRVLELRHIRLKSLPKRAFPELPSLVKLDLHDSYQTIEKIEPGAFEGLTNLRHLRLLSSKVEKFDMNELFVENRNLMVVNLSGACLDTIIVEKTNKKCCFRNQACTVLVRPLSNCPQFLLKFGWIEKNNGITDSFLF